MSGRLIFSSFLILAVVVLTTCHDDESITYDTEITTSGTLAGAKLFIQHKGEATYYHASGKGNCSFPASKDLMVTALNTTDYADAALCGAYLKVTGPSGTVMVRVTDRCPGGKEGGLDLSQQAFKEIAARDAGRVPVTWKIVSAPLTGPVEYHYMKGTTHYWTAIQVRNHRWPITSLEIQPQGSSDWLRVKRRSYNYFVYPKPVTAGSLRVRITAITGDTLEDQLPEPQSDVTIQGAAQFKFHDF